MITIWTLRTQHPLTFPRVAEPRYTCEHVLTRPRQPAGRPAYPTAGAVAGSNSCAILALCARPAYGSFTIADTIQTFHQAETSEAFRSTQNLQPIPISYAFQTIQTIQTIKTNLAVQTVQAV